MVYEERDVLGVMIINLMQGKREGNMRGRQRISLKVSSLHASRSWYPCSPLTGAWRRG